MNIILKFLFIYLEISWLSFLKYCFCQVKSWRVLFYRNDVARVFYSGIWHFRQELLMCLNIVRVILKKLLKIFPIFEYFFILLIWWTAVCLLDESVEIIYHDFYFIFNTLRYVRRWFPLHFDFLRISFLTYLYVLFNFFDSLRLL